MTAQIPQILQLLSRADVEFIVVGGVAASAHGSPRLTNDVDVVYRRTSENVDRLAASLAPQHPYVRGAPPGLPFVWDARTIKAGRLLRIEIGEIGEEDPPALVLQEPHPPGHGAPPSR